MTQKISAATQMVSMTLRKNSVKEKSNISCVLIYNSAKYMITKVGEVYMLSDKTKMSSSMYKQGKLLSTRRKQTEILSDLLISSTTRKI